MDILLSSSPINPILSHLHQISYDLNCDENMKDAIYMLSNQYIFHLKLTQLCANYMSIKLENK